MTVPREPYDGPYPRLPESWLGAAIMSVACGLVAGLFWILGSLLV